MGTYVACITDRNFPINNRLWISAQIPCLRPPKNYLDLSSHVWLVYSKSNCLIADKSLSLGETMRKC